MATCFLVLTDFTLAADQALAYADILAAPLGASLVLLHIRRESLLDPDAFNGLVQRMTEGEVAAALAKRTATLTAPVTVEISVAAIAEAVQQAVAQYQPLLLVLGKPDSGPVPDELVTTTSLKLLRATPLPLLVVPGTASASVRPARVTVAADGQPFQLHPVAAEAARQLLAALAPAVTITYVAEPEDSDDCTAARATVLENHFLPATTPIHSRGTRHRQPTDGILQAATETQADLLLLVARHRSFWGNLFHHSVSTQLVLHSPMPVLLLPALP